MATTLTPRTEEGAGRRTRPLPPGLAFVHRALALANIPCELVLPDGTVPLGEGPPDFRLRFHTETPFRHGLSERAVAEAYVDGEFDVEGDMLRALAIRERGLILDRHSVAQLLRIWLGHFFGGRLRTNRRVIARHYDLGDDFYLPWLDTRYRVYSHGIFRRDDEDLEAATEHKLEQAFRALRLEPGMRVLDLGAGFGAAEQYFGSRGVHVTGLTLGNDSRRFVQARIDREQLDADVHLEDFLAHVPDAPYDALVSLGSIEHITDYRRFARQVWRCVKPGGLVYLDAAASREKYDVSSWTRAHIWTGTHTWLCLQDLLREYLYHGIDVLEVENETRSYGLTCAEWARRFDAAHDRIVSQRGERLWRAWRLYLWGGADAMLRNELQAYHVLGRRSENPGPRPGWWRRAMNGVKSIV